MARLHTFSAERGRKVMRTAKTAAALLISMLLITIPILAQTSTGGANGTVTDPSGAVVSGAAVKLVNQATNIENKTETTSSGYFVFVNVQPGTYVLSVEKQG